MQVPTKPPVIHHHPARQPSTKPPLLFVHGGYSNAALWGVRFIPYFQGQGYDCYALEFSGHGSRPADRVHLDDFGIDDYVTDLAAAVASLPAAPVLIGHSMGCLVSQRFLEQGTARAVAFLAPVPPTGTGGTVSRFALTMPDFFAELPNAVNGTVSEKTMRTMARVYFSPSMAPEETVEYLPLIQPESEKAVTEMLIAPLRSARGRARIPALVMGGSADQVFPASMLFFTAASWNAKTQIIDGAGHMLMLDPQWTDAAGKLEEWLESLA
ncbi:MAG: Alpha/beta hydrolase fold protein [Proteobacteria bacterium]|nr:Alpha/beta hydrolase fold protein [Pseudomonadota bacterium]